MRPYRYTEADKLLATILSDMRVLSGDAVLPAEPAGITWQDVAGTLAVNLRALAAQIDAARAGKVADGPLVFPSPNDHED
jgi:hypothetical protein